MNPDAYFTLAKCHPIAGQYAREASNARADQTYLYRSEVDDVNLGLEHYYGDFNVVHGRLISTGVRSTVRSSVPFMQIKNARSKTSRGSLTKSVEYFDLAACSYLPKPISMCVTTRINLST
jgi:hypothetical protein